ncbi:Aspartyl/asparaginyl beta-hydroxylase [Nymphon striatum]|nr:Aspartyl/asparaginyl beta-hydroxylase [Nymphon striatum]
MSDHETRRRKKRKSQAKNDVIRTDSESDKNAKNTKEGKKSKRPPKHQQHEETVAASSGTSGIIKCLFFVLIILLAVGVGIVMLALKGTDSSSSFSEEVVEKIQTLISDMKPESVPAHVEYDPIIMSEDLGENVLNEAELQDTYGIHLGMSHSSSQMKMDEFSESSPAASESDESIKSSDSQFGETLNTEEFQPPSVEETPFVNSVDEKKEGSNIEQSDKQESVITELSDQPSIVNEQKEFVNIQQNVQHQPVEEKEPDRVEQSDHPETSPEIEVGVDAQRDTNFESNFFSVSSQDDKSVHQYEKNDITNDYDYTIHQELDEADKYLENSPDQALSLFKQILNLHTQSARATFGLAEAHDKLSSIHRSNTFLDLAIASYTEVLDMKNVPPLLFLLSAEKAANRSIFRGSYGKAVKIQKRMIEYFPQNVTNKNQLAVYYLMMGKNKDAEKVFQEVLEIDPSNGFAKTHLGFIWKTDYSDYEKSAKLMSEGIASKAPGTIDGRFFYHLGDAYFRLGLPEKAQQVYISGVEQGLFMSADQRSLYNVEHLLSKPWWNVMETRYAANIMTLEKNWRVIRNEGLSLLHKDNSGFSPESEGLQDKGEWKQFELFARGRRNDNNCIKAPKTCNLMMDILDAVRCTRCQIKFSVMFPGTHVWPHTGPTNCRLRAHLGLVVPPGPLIRVSNETRCVIIVSLTADLDIMEYFVIYDPN